MMRIRQILLIFFLTACAAAGAQAGYFQIMFGGADYDFLTRSIHRNSNVVSMIGYTRSYGNGDYDILICNIDSNGNPTQSLVFGGTLEDVCLGADYRNGRYYLAGYTRNWGPSNPVPNGMITSLDSNLNLVWSLVIGDASSELFSGILVHPNDTFIYAYGRTNSSNGNGGQDIILVKLSRSGYLVWQKLYGTTADEVAVDMIVNKHGNLAMTYTTLSSTLPNTADIGLLVLDTSGAVQWSRKYGGTMDDSHAKLKCTKDSGYIIAADGYSYGFGSSDIFLFKLDKMGNPQWFHTYGDMYDDGISDVLEVLDAQGTPRNYYICGSSPGLEDTAASWGNYRAFLICTDISGQHLWTRMYGQGPLDQFEELSWVEGSGLFLSGTAGNSQTAGTRDFWMVFADSLGYSGCNQFSNQTPWSTYTMPWSSQVLSVLQPTAVSSLIIPVISIATPDTNVICGGNIVTGGLDHITESSVLIYPNPASDFCSIRTSEWKRAELQLMDLTGKVVFRQVVSVDSTTIDLGPIAAGMYFLKLEREERSVVGKVLKR